MQFELLESRVLLSVAPLGVHGMLHGGHEHLVGFGDVLSPAVQPVDSGQWASGAPSAGLGTPVLALVTASAKEVDLSWGAISGATGYYLYRSTNGGRYSQIATVAGTAYPDTSVAASTPYVYYLVAYQTANRKTTLSANSNTISVTTPALVAPTAPAGLTASVTYTNAVALSWTGVANASGYYVLRSTDNGATYSQVASIAASSTAYSDTVAPGEQYLYEVSAWNSAGPGAATGPVSASTALFTRYGGELVVAGTSGIDSITVTESNNQLIINGTTEPLPSIGLFIYSDGGTDAINVDNTITVPLTIATVDGGTTTIINGDAKANIWMELNDTNSSGLGSVHTVTNFYENVPLTVGANIAEPKDAGKTFRATASLWGTGPVIGDVNQGGIGDCYFLASLAAFANTTSATLQNTAVDLGDGTYAVEYLPNGAANPGTFVRVDGLVSSGPYAGYENAQPGASGNIWALIMEKSFAYFRTGANTFASLNGGWMSEVYSDFGIANTNISLSTTESAFDATLTTAVNLSKPVTFATYVRPPNLVGNHVYTFVGMSLNSKGQILYEVRNPWGVSGDRLENSQGYAFLTFAQMQANFQLGTVAT